MPSRHCGCYSPGSRQSRSSNCDGELDSDVSLRNHRYQHQLVSAWVAPNSLKQESKIVALKLLDRMAASNNFEELYMAKTFIADSYNTDSFEVLLFKVALLGIAEVELILKVYLHLSYVFD